MQATRIFNCQIQKWKVAEDTSEFDTTFSIFAKSGSTTHPSFLLSEHQAESEKHLRLIVERI